MKHARARISGLSFTGTSPLPIGSRLEAGGSARRFLCAVLCCLATPASGLRGAEDDFFTSKVESLLRQRCFECHSHAGDINGGLVLDSRSGWETGGDSGAAVVPGDLERSLLIKAVRYATPNLEMPPSGRLPDEEIAILEEWVTRGAPDPREPVAVAAKKPGVDMEAGRRHWAFQPVRETDLPTVHDKKWPLNEIDSFILHALEARGLTPAPPALPSILIRRLSFDLTGLPPTPDEVDTFCRATDADAVESLVDRLLASPRFGERWGRHWLDVARYGDSVGGGINNVLDDAWRYRDYVVSSFNADKPYDRFVVEQIAGDLLPAQNESQRVDQLVATGFLMLGLKDLAEYDREKLRMDIVDEQLDTLGKVFLGLGLGCARCHDHKFDPVPTQDYYAMAGILRSTDPLDEKKSKGLFASLKRLPLPHDSATAAELAGLGENLAGLKTQLAEAQAAAKMTADAGKHAAEDRVKSLREQVTSRELMVDGLSPAVLAVGEEPEPGDSPVLIRGDVHNRGARVPRGFLTIVRLEHPPHVPEKQSGRLELAQWLTHPDNPLLARVMVNRVWHWLMGAGIVRTVDDFGARGEAPSHPELLDHLARRFMDRGWSVKTLVREIVLSRTYRQSGSAAAVQTDPENRLYGRHDRRRLDAEEIHDALLAVSGTLDETIGGPTCTFTGRLEVPRESVALARDPSRRRGLYQPMYRGGAAPDLFRLFDFPDAGLVTGRRNVTTVAPQALFLLNSPVMLGHARHTARRLLSESDADAERIRSLYRRLFGRGPDEPELARGLAFLDDTADSRETAWAALCQSLMISSPFLFVE